jgi:hypothetical protein
MRCLALTVLCIAVIGAFAAPLPRRDDPARHESLRREAEEYRKAAEKVLQHAVERALEAGPPGREAVNSANREARQLFRRSAELHLRAARYALGEKADEARLKAGELLSGVGGQGRGARHLHATVARRHDRAGAGAGHGLCGGLPDLAGSEGRGGFVVGASAAGAARTRR